MTNYYIKKDNKILLFDEDKQKLQDTIAFMPQYKGLEIQEVEEGYVIYDFELMTIEEKEEKEAQKERERLDMLFLTGADVERGIYQAKGMDFDDIMAFVMANPPAGLDVKALRIELKANNFYRGSEYVSKVGALLGFTEKMLDDFFQYNDYKYLTTCTLTINTTPIEATVTGAGDYPYGTAVDVKVECEGYVTHTETVTLIEDKTLNIELDEVQDEYTTDTTESDISI